MGHIQVLDLGNVKLVRNFIYYLSPRSKSAQNVDLKNVFPRFWVLVLKHSSFITDFAYHGFSFPPKKRDEQGPPVTGLCPRLHVVLKLEHKFLPLGNSCGSYHQIFQQCQHFIWLETYHANLMGVFYNTRVK